MNRVLSRCQAKFRCDDARSVNGYCSHRRPGLLLVVLVTAANQDGGAVASQVLSRLDTLTYSRLQVVFVDQKYHNHAFEKWLATERPGIRLEIPSRPPESKELKPLKVRWVVERTHAWLGRCRCNSKDYERTQSSSEAMMQVSSIRLTLRRLDAGASQVTG